MGDYFTLFTFTPASKRSLLYYPNITGDAGGTQGVPGGTQPENAFFIFFSPRLGSMSKISYRVFRDFLIRSTFFSNLGGTQRVPNHDFGLEGIGCIFYPFIFCYSPK